MDINWDQLGRAPNIFAEFGQGYQLGRGIKQDRAQTRADNVFASGDDAAAEKAYIQAGDIQSANAIHGRRREDQREVSRRAAAGKVAAGDYEGGRTSAIEAGDTELASQIGKLDDDKRERLKQHSQVVGAALHSLKGPDGQPLPDAAPRWENMKRRLQAEGYKPEELDLDVTKPGVIDGGIAEAMTVYQAATLAEQGRHNREMEKKGPTGFTRDAEGNLTVDPNYVAGRKAISDATRAPPRARAPVGGGKRAVHEYSDAELLAIAGGGR